MLASLLLASLTLASLTLASPGLAFAEAAHGESLAHEVAEEESGHGVDRRLQGRPRDDRVADDLSKVGADLPRTRQCTHVSEHRIDLALLTGKLQQSLCVSSPKGAHDCRSSSTSSRRLRYASASWS